MAATPKTPSKFRVLVGLNYGPTDTRAEENDIVSDLPAASIPWLLDQGFITTDLTVPPVAEEA